MIQRFSLCLVSLMIIGAASVDAGGDMSGLYDTAMLEYWQTRYSRSMGKILEVILDHLTPEEYARVAGVKIEFPLKNRQLINFYAKWPPSRIVIPVSALKFLDDLYIAYAWLQVNNYRLETTEEYVAMLKYKGAHKFPGDRYPRPLQALRIPPNALKDPRVDGLSLRLFNSGRAFILAHELGHILYRHRGSTVKNEKEADSFALEVLRRTSTLPMGMVLFFQATALSFPNRADYSSDQEWEKFLRTKATHPLNARRLYSLSKTLDVTARDFARHEQDPTAGAEIVLFISKGIRQVADYLDDTELQRCVAEHSSQADPSSLKPRTGGRSLLNC